MDLGLKGSTAIVTGGTQGIGKVIALALAQEGANIVIVDINEQGGDKAVKECKQKQVDALMIKTDVSRFEEVDAMVKTTLDRFGKVDIMVHNAITFLIGSFAKLPKDTWGRVIDVGLYGALNCSKAVIDLMIAQKKGRIINIGSDAGRTGDQSQAVYASVKGGIVSFTKSLAQEIGQHGITVNCVSPSLTLTEDNREMMDRLIGKEGDEKRKRVLSMYPLRKLGTGEDIADMVVFLASERAGHITGQTISVNGGYCMP